MFFPSTVTSSSSATSTSNAFQSSSSSRSNSNHQAPYHPRSRTHSTLSLPTTASASVHVRYLYLAGRYRDLSEEHGLGIVGKTGGLLDQVEEEREEREPSSSRSADRKSLLSGSETEGSLKQSNKRRSIRLIDIFLGSAQSSGNAIPAISSQAGNNTLKAGNASKIHAPHGARHGSLRGYAQQRLKIQEKIEGRIRRATDTKRLEWEAQAALLASSHPLALLLLTRAGVLGSNSASLQLASLYSSGVVRGVSPSVVLIHRDPIRSISWLIRSNEILKAQVQEVQMEKDRLKKESSLSGAFGGKRPGMGHRRSLSGQSQRAGLIPDIQLSVTTSKMIANCPFSLLNSKSLEDPLSLLGVLVRVVRTNQSGITDGRRRNVELINVGEDTKGVKMVFEEENIRNNLRKEGEEKKELWQEVEKLVNWMEMKLPYFKNSSVKQAKDLSNGEENPDLKRFLTQAQLKVQASQESNQANLKAKGPSSELPLSPINQTSNSQPLPSSNEFDPLFSPGPDDVDEIVGVAWKSREVRIHLGFLHSLMGLRDFCLTYFEDDVEKENFMRILKQKLEMIVELFERTESSSESSQMLPFSTHPISLENAEPISKSSSTILSLGKQSVQMIRDLQSLIRGLQKGYEMDDTDEMKEIKEKIEQGLKEIGDLMEGSLAEVVVPSVTSNAGVSNGSELQSSLSSSSNKRFKSSSTKDSKLSLSGRRKSLEDLPPIDVDSTENLNQSQRPALLSFPSSNTNINAAQTKVDNVIAPGETPIRTSSEVGGDSFSNSRRQIGRTLSSVSQLRVAMPSSTSTRHANEPPSPADSLMSTATSSYGFPTTSVDKGGWNSLGLEPGGLGKNSNIRRPSSVVSDSPSLLFPSQQDEEADSRPTSPYQERGSKLGRSDSLTSSLWTGSIPRRRAGASDARRRVTSLYGEPSIAVGMERSVSGSSDMNSLLSEEATSSIPSSSSNQQLNAAGQFDPTKSLRELSSRRRGSNASTSSKASNFSNYSSNPPFFSNAPSMRSLTSNSSLSSLNVNDHGFSHQMNGSAGLGRQAVDSLRKLRGQLPTSHSSTSSSQKVGFDGNGDEGFDPSFTYQPRKRTGSSASMPAHPHESNQANSPPSTSASNRNPYASLRRIPSSSSTHTQGGSRIPSLKLRPPSTLSPSLSFLQSGLSTISTDETSITNKDRNFSSTSRNGALSPTSPISPTGSTSNSALGTLRKIGLEAQQSKKRSDFPKEMRVEVEAPDLKDPNFQDKDLLSPNTQIRRSFMGIDPTKSNSLYGSVSNNSSNSATPTPQSPLSPTSAGARSPTSDDSSSVGKGKGRALDSDQLDSVLARAEEKSKLKTDANCDECGTLVVNAPISRSGLKFCGRDCRIQAKEREKEKRKELERRKEVKEREKRELERAQEKEKEGQVEEGVTI